MTVQETTDIHGIKEQLATQYIAIFRKELGISESEVLNSIVEKMKDTLVSQDKTVEEMMKDFSGLSPDMREKIKTFLQEKKDILAKSNTEEELKKLEDNIKPYEPNLLINLGIVGGGGGTAEYLQSRVNKKTLNKMMTELEPELRKSTQEIIQKLHMKIRSPESTTWQKVQSRQLLKDFTNAEKNLASADALPKWKSLVEEGVLKADLLSKLKISESAMESLKLIQKDEALLAELAGKSKQEIQAILKNKGITNLSSEVIDVLVKGSEKGLLGDTLHVLLNIKGLKYIGKALRGLPVFDLLFVGYSTYEYLRGERDDRSTAKFTINALAFGGLAAVQIAAWTGLIAAGPGGWVTAGVIGLVMAVEHGIDVGYYDLKDFYHQQKKDLLTQEKVELKEALVQAVAGGTRSNLSINEDTYDTITRWCGGDLGKTQTAENAFYALVYGEELTKGSSIESTDPKVIQKDLDDRILLRMQYLKNYLPGGFRLAELSSMIQQSQGMKAIDKLLADSEIYAQMKSDTTTSATTIDEYKEEQIQILQSENPTVCTKLDELIQKDPVQAAEFFEQVKLYAQAAEANNESRLLQNNEDLSADEDIYEEVSNDVSTIDYQRMDQAMLMAKFIDRYKKAKNLVLPQVEITEIKSQTTEDSLISLGEGNSIVSQSKNRSENLVKENLVNNMNEIVEDGEYSDDLRQNIIYRMAKTFHGYTGPNNMQALEMYFMIKKEGDDNKKGLYYDPGEQKWMINNDYAKDCEMNFQDIETKSVEEVMTDWFKELPFWQTMFATGVSPGVGLLANYVLPKTSIQDMIDTPTETTDGQLNKEFFETMQTILTKEKQALDPMYIQAVDKEIHDYIDANVVDGYIKLPGYITQKAQRAGFGNLSYRYFTKKEGKIIALTTNMYASQKMLLSGVERQYIDDVSGKAASGLDEAGIAALPTKKLNEGNEKIISKVNLIATQIIKTAGEMSRANRGEVKYDPLTKKLSSRNASTKISEKNGKYILDDGKLPIEYATSEEAVHMAIVKNWFSGDYKVHKNDAEQDVSKRLPVELKYGRYMGAGPKGLYDVNTGFWGTDTRLLTQDFIDKNLPTSFSNEQNQKLVMEYLQN